MFPFRDRRQAGRMLASELLGVAPRGQVVVLGLPRGGIPVAFEVARALEAPLDAFAVRKVGAPGHEEYAIGALASGGIEYLDHERIGALGVSLEDVRSTIAAETAELERREREYRDTRPVADLRHKVVILVDDGLATGATMLAAVRAVQMRGPEQIIVAVPVATREACDLLRSEGADCRCVATPEPFLAVGAWYRDFSQTSDDEVRALLDDATAWIPVAPIPS